MDFVLLLALAGLVIIDIVQGAMLTALHSELDYVARICNTYLTLKNKSLQKSNVKSGGSESKSEP